MEGLLLAVLNQHPEWDRGAWLMVIESRYLYTSSTPSLQSIRSPPSNYSFSIHDWRTLFPMINKVPGGRESLWKKQSLTIIIIIFKSLFPSWNFFYKYIGHVSIIWSSLSFNNDSFTFIHLILWCYNNLHLNHLSNFNFLFSLFYCSFLI